MAHSIKAQHNRWRILGKTLISVIIAYGLIMSIIAGISTEPLKAIYYLLTGPLTTTHRATSLINSTIPLIFTGLAFAIMFRSNQINIGVAGYFFIGGVMGSIVAIVVHIPIFSIILALSAATLVGALMAALSAYLKIRWGVLELISSLMMNYILLYFGLFIIQTYFRDYTISSSASIPLYPLALIPKIDINGVKISYALPIALIIVLMVHYVYHTTIGFEMTMVGHNEKFALFMGMNVKQVSLYSQALAGGIAGMGGAIEILNIYNRFRWQELPSFGWDGLIVAIMARNNPIMVPITALFLAYIRLSGDIIARETDMQSEVIATVIPILIILTTAQGGMAMLKQYKRKQEIKQEGGNP